MHAIDLNNMTDAEIGAIVRRYMEAALVGPISTARPEVLAERAAREAAEVEQIAAEQAQRIARLYPEFEINGRFVPAMDLRNVSTLQEMPSAKQRSPYNKALCALGEPLLDRETATYADLVATHERLAARAAGQPVTEPVVEPVTIVADLEPQAEAKPKKAKKAKAKAKAAPVDTPADPKVQALVDLLGITVTEAEARIAALA